MKIIAFLLLCEGLLYGLCGDLEEGASQDNAHKTALQMIEETFPGSRGDRADTTAHIETSNVSSHHHITAEEIIQEDPPYEENDVMHENLPSEDEEVIQEEDLEESRTDSYLRDLTLDDLKPIMDRPVDMPGRQIVDVTVEDLGRDAVVQPPKETLQRGLTAERPLTKFWSIDGMVDGPNGVKIMATSTNGRMNGSDRNGHSGDHKNDQEEGRSDGQPPLPPPALADRMEIPQTFFLSLPELPRMDTMEDGVDAHDDHYDELKKMDKNAQEDEEESSGDHSEEPQEDPDLAFLESLLRDDSDQMNDSMDSPETSEGPTEATNESGADGEQESRDTHAPYSRHGSLRSSRRSARHSVSHRARSPVDNSSGHSLRSCRVPRVSADFANKCATVDRVFFSVEKLVSSGLTHYEITPRDGIRFYKVTFGGSLVWRSKFTSEKCMHARVSFFGENSLPEAIRLYLVVDQELVLYIFKFWGGNWIVEKKEHLDGLRFRGFTAVGDYTEDPKYQEEEPELDDLLIKKGRDYPVMEPHVAEIVAGYNGGVYSVMRVLGTRENLIAKFLASEL